MGRYDELSEIGLLGLGIATMLADFQTVGIEAEDRERLYSWQRNAVPLGPRLRRWWILRESGPGALEVPEAKTAARTCSTEKGLKSGSRGCEPSTERLIRRDSLVLPKKGTLVNWQQKARAI